MMPTAEPIGVLDGLVARVLGSYPYRFTVPNTPAERETAYRIRYQTVLDEGWIAPGDLPDGLERDEFDDDAVQVLGWDGEDAICTGRLVFGRSPLPTEKACGIVVEPRCQVADIGRMTVARTYQTYRHAAFIALLCRLYAEMRGSGYQVACGVMSPRVQTLVRQLGLQLEVLGEPFPYWGEQRAPVRFGLTANALSLGGHWPGGQ